MNILVVCQYYYPEPFRITDICETLTQRGFKITVLTGLPNYPEGKVLKDYKLFRNRKESINGVNVIRCFQFGRGNNNIRLFLNYFSFAISSTLKALCLKDKFDVIFVNQLSPVTMVIPAVIYKLRKHKKLLLYCLDLWPESLIAGGVGNDTLIYKVFLSVSKWIYKTADRILISSKSFDEYFARVIMLNRDKLKYLPQYAEEMFRNNRKNHNINDNRILTESNKTYNFVYAGNVGEQQNIATIINAADILKSHKDIHFHIVGSGSRYEECIRIKNEKQLDNITFYGRKPVEEMIKYYDLADAMLVTLSKNEVISYTVPGKVQSYMAAGKPIIGAINGEGKKIIKEAECGYCCNAEEYKELAALIIKFINNSDKRKMAENSRKYYDENFSKATFFNLLINELGSLGVKNV